MRWICLRDLLMIAAFLSVSPVHAQGDWPRFRGPNADGVTPDDPRLPHVWSKKNVKWVVVGPRGGATVGRRSGAAVSGQMALRPAPAGAWPCAVKRDIE